MQKKIRLIRVRSLSTQILKISKNKLKCLGEKRILKKLFNFLINNFQVGKEPNVNV